MYLSSLVLLPSPDTTEVITIITQKRKGRSSIYKTIFHLHVCMTYFCFIKYKNLSNWKLLFQLSNNALVVNNFFFLVEFFFPCKNNCCIIPINWKFTNSFASRIQTFLHCRLRQNHPVCPA